MGQTKSKPGCKTWRRLSESDCVHLLNDDELNNHYNLNAQNNSFNTNQQEFKYRTITNANKWTQQQAQNKTNVGKFNNLNNDHIFTRNRSGSACMTATTTTGNSDATLLKFSKFENSEFMASNNNSNKQSNQYNKNLFEANKNGGGSIMRKSMPPRPLMAGKQNTLGPSSTSRHTRFGSTYPALLEPELLMLGASNGLLKPPARSTSETEENNSIEVNFRNNDLIESPPPLADMSTNPFMKQSPMRPITMYQLEPFGKQSASSGGLTFSHHPSSVARGLSLSDLLEQCNALEDDAREAEEEEEFSDQTLVDTGGTMGPPADSEERGEVDRNGDPNGSLEKESRNKSCILVDLRDNETSSSASCDQAQLRDHQLSRSMIISPGTNRKNSNSAIRCSGLDCICDRCIAHRFKLLNWLLPNCTRINAERLLHGRMEGTFLVRKSEKFPGQYTLSFVCRRTVRHCLIMRSVYGFGLRWPYSFETLQQVIIHYARTTLAEFNSKLDVRLRYPVFMA